MSIASLTSTSEKSARRVRFSLPEAKLTFSADKRTLHGTSKYVNGTLINVTSSVHTPGDGFKSGAVTAHRGSLKSPDDYKLLLNIRPTTVTNNTRDQCKPSTGYRRRSAKSLTRQSFNVLPTIERKSSSLDEGEFDEIEKPFSNLTKYKSSDDLRDPHTFKIKSHMMRLPDTQETPQSVIVKRTTSNTLKVPEYTCKST